MKLSTTRPIPALMRRTALVAASLLLAASLGACADEDGPQMGDPCTTQADCPEECATGGGFPSGICTRECDLSAECPAGWVCISKDSGLCVEVCENTEDCAHMGQGWICDDEALQEGAGDASVCIGQ